MGPDSHAGVEPKLPFRIGRYEAFLKIGVGGMAHLYLGVQHGPFAVKKLVVIKQLRHEYADDPRFLEMFVDEARIALRLNHPNVVHTYEVLAEEADYYLVMEYLDGQSLLEILQRIERPNMPLHEHLWILTQLLAGLHYAHQLSDFDGKPLKIVHCDVTPSNVFVCRSGEVKLLDFGIAKANGALGARHSNTLKGKLGYLSPEQCNGEPASARSDLYAVGVMLWEAMARRRRMSAENQAAQLQARIKGTEPPIEELWPEAPPALVAIARRALATQPEQRYASAADFQRDLEHFLAEAHSSASAESISRLIGPLFLLEKAALDRAIEARIGGWEASAVPALGGTQSGFVLSRPKQRNDGEEHTSRVDIERLLDGHRTSPAMPEPMHSAATRALLRASRTKQLGLSAQAATAARLHRLGERLQSLRERPGLLVALAAVAGAAAALWLSTNTDRPSTTSTSAATSRPPAAVRGESPPPSAAEQTATVPAPPSEAVTPPANTPLQAPAPLTPPGPNEVNAAARRAPKLATRFNPPPPPASGRARPRGRAARLEPGMDLLREPIRKRNPATLDEDDPYAH